MSKHTLWALHVPFDKHGAPVMGTSGRSIGGVVVMRAETWAALARVAALTSALDEVHGKLRKNVMGSGWCVLCGHDGGGSEVHAPGCIASTLWLANAKGQTEQFVCPTCGDNTKADEDGCCKWCGEDCTIQPVAGPR